MGKRESQAKMFGSSPSGAADKSAKKSIVREALLAAWRNRAPRCLARHHAGTNAPGTGHSPLGQDRTPKDAGRTRRKDDKERL